MGIDRTSANIAIESYIIGNHADEWKHEFISDDAVPCCDIENKVIKSPAFGIIINDKDDTVVRGKNQHEAGHARLTPGNKKSNWSSLKGMVVNSLEDLRIERSISKLSPVIQSDLLGMNQEVIRGLNMKVASGEITLKPVNEALVAMHIMENNISPMWELSPKAKGYFNAAYDEFRKWRDIINADTPNGFYEVEEIADAVIAKLQEEKENQKNQDNGDAEEENQNKNNGKSSQKSNGGKNSDSDGGFDNSDEEEQKNDKSRQNDPKNENNGDSDEDEDDETKSSNGNNDEDEESDSSNGNEDEDDEDADEDGNGGDDDDSDEDGDNDANGQSNSNEDADNGDEDNGEDSESKNNNPSKEVTGDGKKKNSHSKTTENDLNEDFEETNAFDNEVSQKLQKIFDESKLVSNGYTAFIENDTFEKAPENKFRFEKAKKCISSQINQLANYTEDAIKALSRVRMQRNMEHGRIDRKKLASLSKSLTKKVFYKTNEGIDLNVAVSIMIDESGSIGFMCNQLCSLAIAFSEVFYKLGVKFEVTGFTTGYGHDIEISHESLAKFDRTEPMRIIEHKAFGDNYFASKYRLGTIGSHCCNIDGESLMLAFKRINKERVNRRIIFVLSDGMPNQGYNSRALYRHLHNSVKFCRDAGTEVYGFGIGTSEPEKFYGKENFLYLQDISELGQKFFQRFKEIITK